jgi:hypothetical protein
MTAKSSSAVAAGQSQTSVASCVGGGLWSRDEGERGRGVLDEYSTCTRLLAPELAAVKDGSTAVAVLGTALWYHRQYQYCTSTVLYQTTSTSTSTGKTWHLV